MDVDSDDDQRCNGNESDTEDVNVSQSSKNLVAGKIVSIHLQNFLTHTEATVYPNEQLNLVSFPHIFNAKINL